MNKSIPILQELNERQLEAAQTIEGPLLILAGAGSGKTKTITYRLAHMLIDHQIPGSEILALSFTNKAAAEMLSRVRAIVPSRKRRGLNLGTFHALGLRILKSEIHLLGYSPKFSLYDSADQVSIVREGLQQLRGGKNFDRKILHSMIGQLKNKGISPQNYTKSNAYDPANDYCQALEFIYPFYQEKLKFYNAIDFDDILFQTVALFKKFPERGDHYSKVFRYIMIDEYQDTNPLQFEMVQFLTKQHHNVCVVGDDDQAIYGFRGADINNILNFERHYPQTKVIKLEENYRSTQKILNLANQVIKENKKRKDKTMWTSMGAGALPILWQAADSTHEAQLICDEITKLQNLEHMLRDMCILYRSNTQTPPIEDELRMSQIPYQIIGGQKFYEKKEIKDLIAYLCLMKNPFDELSLRRVLNTPTRGIGNVTLDKYLQVSKQSGKSLFHTLEHVGEKDHKTIPSFVTIIKEFAHKFAATDKLKPVVEEFINRIEFRSYIERCYTNPKQMGAKLQDVQQFLDSVDRFDQQQEFENTLEQFVNRILLADSQDKHIPTRDDEGKANEVTLMTLHASKGLEFDVVFLAGMEEELLPHKKCLNSADDLSEERRLAYVGITRAKKQLFMSYCKERLIYNKMIPRKKSRFLIGLEDFYVEQDRNSLGHLSEEEAQDYTKSIFKDLWDSLD